MAKAAAEEKQNRSGMAQKKVSELACGDASASNILRGRPSARLSVADGGGGKDMAADGYQEL
jgi:hypothetical protein